MPCPAQDTKRNRDTNTENSIKYKKAQAQSQEDSFFFPVAGHQNPYVRNILRLTAKIENYHY